MNVVVRKDRKNVLKDARRRGDNEMFSRYIHTAARSVKSTLPFKPASQEVLYRPSSSG